MDISLLAPGPRKTPVVLAFALLTVLMFAANLRADQNLPTEGPAARPQTDVKKLASKLAYVFEPSVFRTRAFPDGSLQLDEKVRSALGPFEVAATFYNEKFEEVKEADVPGRYGAIVCITLGDGSQLNRFVTLYRIPEEASSRLVKFGNVKIPVETGIGPEVARRRLEEVGTALKGGVGSGLLSGPWFASLATALPGHSPDQLLSGLLTFVARDDAWWFELRKRVGLAETYPYQIQLPDGYAADPSKRWPLILYLHGSGDRGDNLATLNHNGLPKRIAAGQKIPAVVVSPQCPGVWWSTPVLSQLIDEVSKKYQIDPDRIIVTGLSMGGFGTWALAAAYPDRFSAIIPICGGGNPADAARLRSLPIWAFHGRLDTTVPASFSEDMIASIRAAGGDPRLTVYPDARHDSWTKTYAAEDLYAWMLAQQRGKPEVRAGEILGR